MSDQVDGERFDAVDDKAGQKFQERAAQRGPQAREAGSQVNRHPGDRGRDDDEIEGQHPEEEQQRDESLEKLLVQLPDLLLDLVGHVAELVGPHARRVHNLPDGVPQSEGRSEGRLVRLTGPFVRKDVEGSGQLTEPIGLSVPCVRLVTQILWIRKDRVCHGSTLLALTSVFRLAVGP
ncbi:hypothetical protein [Actinoplanes sp. NBRC 103695]|uniref:hypothetical protein n=1 Tax=Actinoplanes sp. NBRC 103695 TaxID=3032202 RepID=UPI002555CC8E|nr:hypothetical protein [Actinoplanes sp. NBRC 103695]